MKSRLSNAAQNEKGFTLIELFTAIALLTTGLLGTAAMTAGVMRGNVAGRNQTTATAIAQSCFQENRRVGYTLAGTTGCAVGTAAVPLGGVTFTRVLAAVDTSVTNMKTLTVTVSWSEGTAGNRSITMKTSMASGT
jgi:Tfp pilus assembly protein PilV